MKPSSRKTRKSKASEHRQSHQPDPKTGAGKNFLGMGLGPLIIVGVVLVSGGLFALILIGRDDQINAAPASGLNQTEILHPYLMWDTCGIRSKNPFPFPFPKAQSYDAESESDKESLIAFGENAKLYEYPWMGRVVFAKRARYEICGSSLLNGRFLLTAAHCCEQWTDSETGNFLPGWKAVVNIGVIYFGQEGSIDKKIDRCFIHPRYNFPKNDIALLRIDGNTDAIPHPGDAPYRYNSICLDRQEDYVYRRNIKVEIAGWGSVAVNSSQTDFVLQKGLMTYKNSTDCGRRDSRPIIYCFHVRQYFAHTCKGDSGGPLMFQEGGADTPVKQIGIISFSEHPDSEDWCGKIPLKVYMQNVYQHIDWIYEKMAEEWPDPIEPRTT